MKILATCLSCPRDFQLDQLLEGPVITGACPWCGEILAPSYTTLLPELIRRADRGGDELLQAIEILNGSWARFRLRPASVLEPLREALRWPEEAEAERAEVGRALRRSIREVEEAAAAGRAAWESSREGVRAVEDALLRRGERAAEVDRRAAERAGAGADVLARADAGGDPTAVRREIERLGTSEGRLAEAADGIARAREAADAATSDEELREALARLRAALEEAERALDAHAR